MRAEVAGEENKHQQRNFFTLPDEVALWFTSPNLRVSSLSSKPAQVWLESQAQRALVTCDMT